MASKWLAPPKSAPLYDQDFLVWTEQTARLLRAGRFDELDVEHLAEEVEDMGKSQKHELHSRLTVLILHLLKWRYQAGRRSRSWRDTIAVQRADIRRVLRGSPSLRPTIPAAIGEIYDDAVERAHIQTGLPADAFPDRCPFTPEEILNRDFLPD